MKSLTCFSKRTNQPLTEFLTEAEAESSAFYEKLMRGIDLYVYQCDKCGLFHLAPEDSKLRVKKNTCYCRDSRGNPKALYLTIEDAKKQQAKSQREQHIQLKIYPFEQRLGYHLTHMI